MKKYIFVAMAAITAYAGMAQELTYTQYMERVLADNIALTAEKLNIDIAAAKTEAAKSHNDPTIALTYSSNEDWNKKLGYTIESELSRTFTFGVRRGRIRVAESEQTETATLVEEYMRNFRADATIAYLEQIKYLIKLELAVQKEQNLLTVARGDSLRHLRGDIAKSDRLESKSAAAQAHNSRLAAEAAVKSSAIRLGYFMGNMAQAESIRVTGTLDIGESPLPPDEYVNRAIENRADLQAALGRVDIAEAVRKFNAAQRRTDIGVTIGATYNRGARAEEPAEPSFTTVKAGVAVPLKFSNLNKGARTIDRLAVQQAEQNAEEARLAVHSEVLAAYNEYRYAIMQCDTYNNDILNEMNEVVANKRKAYEAGDISFLEYISTERQKTEMDDDYVETLFNKAVKWVELQRAVGCTIKR